MLNEALRCFYSILMGKVMASEIEIGIKLYRSVLSNTLFLNSQPLCGVFHRHALNVAESAGVTTISSKGL
jgi:hypothetical protein